MNKHTPGPWTIREYQDYTGSGVEIAQSGSNPRLHIVRDIMGDNIEQSDANARLIAAAPELLTMLTRVMDEVMMSEEVFSKLAPLTLKQARDAINKAKGITA